MNTNDLQLFEAVAAQGSFTHAAKKMFTVQSNVTARIKNLEEELGAELFDRNTRKVELTIAGKTLIRYSRQIIRLLDEAKKSIDSDGQVAGQVRIGCVETTMALKAPTMLARFAELYPEVHMEFKSARRHELLEDILDYKLDLAFVSAPLDTTELTSIVVKQERIRIIASGDTVKLEDCLSSRQLRVVVFELGQIYRTRLEAYLSSKGVFEYQLITVNSFEGIINFVEAGLGISALPEEVLTGFYSKRKLKTFPLKKDLGLLTTLLIYRRDITLTRATEAFIDLYRSRRAK